MEAFEGPPEPGSSSPSSRRGGGGGDYRPVKRVDDDNYEEEAVSTKQVSRSGTGGNLEASSQPGLGGVMEEASASAERPPSEVDENKGRSCCSATTIVHPVLVLVQLIFSGYHVLGSKAVNIDPNNREAVAMVFALYRELSASLLMGLLAVQAAWLGGHRLTIERKHWLRFIILGVFSFGNVVGAVEALTKASPTNLAVMQPAIPVFCLGLSVLAGIERFTILKGLGLAMAVAGAVTVEVVKPGKAEGNRSASDVAIGNVIIILQCLSMAALLVVQKGVLSSYHPTVVTAWYYSIGAVLTVVVCLAKDIPSRIYTFGGSGGPWIALTYAAIFATFFNYNAYSWAGSTLFPACCICVVSLTGTVIAPATISIYSTLQPIGTAILSVIFLKENPTVPEILCGILVVAGLILTGWAKSQEEKRARELQRQSSADKVLPLVDNDANTTER